jgi:rubrerythrin
MALKGSKTEQILRNLFSAELEVQARYEFFAEAAEKAGVGQVADMFLAIANNETEHAGQALKFLGGAEDVRRNPKRVIEHETKDFQGRYSEAAETAAEEGFDDIALFFVRSGMINVATSASLPRC